MHLVFNGGLYKIVSFVIRPEFDGFLVYVVDNDTIFYINEVGKFILDIINTSEKQLELIDVINSIKEEYLVEKSYSYLEDVTTYIYMLIKNGLLQKCL